MWKLLGGGLRLSLAAVIVLGAGITGCAQTRPPADLSRGLAYSYDVQCSPQRIQVLETRWVGRDQIYVLEACGETLELEFGLELPRTAEELERYSYKDVPKIEGTLKPFLPRAITEEVREKAAEYCVLESAPRRSLGEVRFSNATPEELAKCQDRVRKAVVPLGTDIAPGTEETRYWFVFNKWVFAAWPTLHRPACSRRQVQAGHSECSDLPEAEPVQGAVQASSAEGGQEVPEAARAAAGDARSSGAERTLPSSERQAPTPLAQTEAHVHDGFFFRMDFGAGMLSLESNQTPSFSSPTLGGGFWLGSSPIPGLVLGSNVALHVALSGYPSIIEGVCVNGSCAGEAEPWLRAISGFVMVYPNPRAGTHVDLSLGYGSTTGLREVAGYTLGEPRSGFVMGLGFGYESWIGSQASLGITGQLNWMPSGADSMSAVAPGLVGSVTYH